MVLFNDRLQAGDFLAEKFSLLKPQPKDPIVLGIPRGGIPVGSRLAKSLASPLDTIVLRKLPIPTNPEAGFGAVTLDKTVIFNQELLPFIHLDNDQIDQIIHDVYQEVLRRNQVYRKGKPFPSLEKRSVILSDDGLASGFTMLAAVKFVRKRKAGEVIVAVPVAHRQAYDLVRSESDGMVVLHISDAPYFAVASFYQEFPEMSDREVISYLKRP
jgi:putative phosphoribosyl transferase